MHVVIRDNAANMVAGIRECELPAIDCAIHTLQLVVKDSIMIQRTVIDMLARCRKLVGHFKHSSLAYQHLHNIQSQLSLPEHKLIQDEPTRWDSTYYMLSHIIQQRRAITLYDTDFGLPEQLNSNEWQQAEKIVKLLEPVQRVTKELSGKDAMLSQVIPFIEILKMEMGSTGDDDRGIISNKEVMLKSLKSRFEHVYSDDNCVIATLLDPRFKSTFYDAAATESAIQTLVALCEDLNEQQNQMPTSQKAQDSQQALGESVENSSIEPISTETSKSATITTASGKKGFSNLGIIQKSCEKTS